jgi:hypothetical protein
VPGGELLASALDFTMLGAGTFAMLIFYGAAEWRVGQRLTPLRALEIVFALCLGVGLSVQNAREVLAGLRSRRSAFVRTPKRGDASKEQAIAAYRTRAPWLFAVVELLFAAYFLGATIYAFDQRLWGALPFLALYWVGFTAIAAGVLLELGARPLRSRAPANEAT